MSEKKTVHTYSGQGKHLENAVLFIGGFVFLLLGLYYATRAKVKGKG